MNTASLSSHLTPVDPSVIQGLFSTELNQEANERVKTLIESAAQKHYLDFLYSPMDSAISEELSTLNENIHVLMVYMIENGNVKF